jgi:hypothetical protein
MEIEKIHERQCQSQLLSERVKEKNSKFRIRYVELLEKVRLHQKLYLTARVLFYRSTFVF